MFHSRLFSLGKPPTDLSKEALLDGILSAVLDAIGPEGTLIAPTFTFAFCKSGVFDIEKTPSEMGALTEAIRRHPSAMRTSNPIYSVAVIGKERDFFLKASPATCFGPGSVFDLMSRRPNMKIAVLGFPNPCEALSYLHFLEEKMKVSYRYIKTFKGKVVSKGAEHAQETAFFVRDLKRNVRLSWENAYDILLRDNAVNTTHLGGSLLHLMDRGLIDRSIQKALAINPEAIAHYSHQ
jgi:aminoglycoside 3-N-acetyltransferase